MEFLVGTDDGLLAVHEEAGTVEALGLAGASVRAVHRTPDGRLWVGTGDPGGSLSGEGHGGLHLLEGGAWHRVAERQVVQGWSIAHLPWAEGTLLVGTLPPALFRSDDGGASWSEVDSLHDVASRDTWTFFGGPETAHVRSIAACPELPDVMVVGIEVGGVAVSEDGGASWEDRTGPVDPDVHSVHLFRRQPGRLLATCQAGVFLSDDLGRSWEPEPRARGYFVSTCVSADERVIYSTSVTEGAPVHRSDDGGRTWRAGGGGLPAPSFSADNVAADPQHPERVAYAGNAASGGAFHVSEDGGERWRRVAELPATPRRVRLA